MQHQQSTDPVTHLSEEDRGAADPNLAGDPDPDDVPEASAGPEDAPVDPTQPLNPA